MHDLVAVQRLHGLAHLAEDPAHLVLLEVVGLDVLVQRAAARVLQHHVGGVPGRVVVVVQQLDHARVRQLLVQRDLVLRVLAVDLNEGVSTILMATYSCDPLLRASFTSP